MEKQIQTMDKQANVGSEKKSYETPTLTKLGTVQQVTQGTPVIPVSDDGFSSI